MTESIELKNVRVHNLKGIDLSLKPRALIVFTGVSGSGKSSLAFDTIYVEGQRRYVESLSHQARLYVGHFKKPEADRIEGISPTIAIEQKTVGRNPRSTVGTLTGIHDYLRVLFARIGTPYCPISQERVEPQSIEQVLHQLREFPKKACLIFLAPYIDGKKGEWEGLFKELIRKGFIRVRLDGEIVELKEGMSIDKTTAHTIDLVVDRIVLKEENGDRLIEATTEAFELGKGMMIVLNQMTGEEYLFSRHAYAKQSKQSYESLEPRDFSFNHPKGMCPTCEGLGVVQDFNLSAIIDPEKSIAEDCCLVAGSYHTIKWGNIYRNIATLYGFDIKTPWKKLPLKAQKQFLYGNQKKWTKMVFTHPDKKREWVEYIHWRGVLAEAKKRYQDAKSEAHRSKMKKLMEEQVCFDCKGSRLKPYPSATKLGNQTIQALTDMPLEKLQTFFNKLSLSPFQETIGRDLVAEIQKRLHFLSNVGLHYLTLGRTAPSLSGGEGQRVRLASQIGCGLVGSTYILDEPSIGLHARDQAKLINTLKALRDQGNTILVVEHDLEMMEAADTIVDIGPGAGANGGEVVAIGTIEEIKASPRSLTGAYLSGKCALPTSKNRKKKPNAVLTIQGATHHNLKNIDVDIPLGLFIAVTGVSGSGKSSLINGTLYPALANALHRADRPVGTHQKIQGIEQLDKVVAIDQTPIGKTPRSNPSTYLKIFDEIRILFAELPDSQAAGFKERRFSFNVKEGSCPECKGMGAIRLDMDFMEEAWIPCSVCGGKRFDSKTLSITYKGKTIHDVLEMTVEEAYEFFEPIPQIRRKLSFLKEVGLDYMPLGRPFTTLSGGEGQRIKLAKELLRPSTGKTLYLLDEPTTGLHFHDMKNLIAILQRLVDKGNTVLVIEHQIDLIRSADWIIDLGPEGGEGGGKVLATGTPKEIAKKKSATGLALRSSKKGERPSFPSKVSPSPVIQARGCCQNHLKDIDVSLPRGKISICSGPSGSGKSSFAFETLYAEGQRLYVETLSMYARQFVKQMPKPKVKEIEGLSPAIAIEQKRRSGNPRSTIGTMTEIYDFLRLLYSHMGIAYCPETGEKIESITEDFVVAFLMKLPEKTPLHILAPISIKKGQSFEEIKDSLTSQGLIRIRLNNIYYELDESIPYQPHRKNRLFVIIDRLCVRPGIEKRLFEAIEGATSYGQAPFTVATPDQDFLFHLAFSAVSSGKTYPPLTPKTFSFNAEEGMCLDCLGLGIQWDANLFSNPQVMALSARSLLLKLWKEEKKKVAEEIFLTFLKKEGIDPDTPLYALPAKQLDLLIHGSKTPLLFYGMELYWSGISPTFSRIAKVGKNTLKESLKPFLDASICPTCSGDRLNPLARHVKLKGKTIGELCSLPLSDVLIFVQNLPAPLHLKEVIDSLIKRLTFLNNLGLGYLSLSRSAPTLSGGETKRIHLARQLGSGLTGCLYILDEPTVGLHPHDHKSLSKALEHLRDLGNTLLLVEHDPLSLKIADYLLDFGPKAGKRGGKLIAEGSLEEIQKRPESLTGAYLSGKKKVPLPDKRRTSTTSLTISNANKHDLKNLTVSIPIQTLTCVTGVSGSGKSTLIQDLLKRGVQLHFASRSKADTMNIEGAQLSGLSLFDSLVTIDQNPIGITIRADVSTYTDLNAPLRYFFSSLPEAQARGLAPKHFSSNHIQGMCRKCWGLGVQHIQLQFLPSIQIPCEACNGARLNPLSLKVTYRGKHFAQLLSFTAEKARTFLPAIPKIQATLNTLISIGLAHLTLNQSIASLSVGEVGRLRLARELSKRKKGRTLYLFDEPTIGLHPKDVAELLSLFQALVDQGHTVVVIEHNLDLIAAADYLIDLGPGAGPLGGKVIAVGTPEEISQNPASLTGNYLAKILHRDKVGLPGNS